MVKKIAFRKAMKKIWILIKHFGLQQIIGRQYQQVLKEWGNMRANKKAFIERCKILTNLVCQLIKMNSCLYCSFLNSFGLYKKGSERNIFLLDY